MNIQKATIILSSTETDKVYLHTNLPSPCPNLSKQNLTLLFNVEKDKGVEYVKKHFNIEPEVVKG